MTDGTTAGTTEVATFDGTLADAMAFDGKFAFIETTPDGTDSSLWVSDGTASGTTQVTSFPSQDATYGVETPTMAVLDGKLYISAPPLPSASSTGLATLWVSDGTTAGTMPLAGAPASTNVDTLTVYQGKLYFSIDTPTTQLWVTDGTTTGTRMVGNVGSNSATVDRFLAAGPNLYIFTSGTGLNGGLFEGLYKSDGTARGTVLIHRFVNSDVIAASGLPNGDLALDMSGPSLNPTPQLWLSNGTAAGTTLVKDVGGGFGYLGTGDGAIAPINGVFYLQGTDSKHGTELWQSNGTIAGTTLVQDINPGKVSSYPYVLTVLNGNLIVAADDGVHGRELLSGPIPAAARGREGSGSVSRIKIGRPAAQSSLRNRPVPDRESPASPNGTRS